MVPVGHHWLLPQEGLLQVVLLVVVLLPLEGLLHVPLLVAFLHHLFQNNCNDNIITLSKQ